MTPEELAGEFLRLDEIGTEDQPRQRLVLQLPSGDSGMVIDAGTLAEGCSLTARRSLYVDVLARLAERALTEVTLPTEAQERTIYDRLQEDEP
jgi:hypothetical protein